MRTARRPLQRIAAAFWDVAGAVSIRTKILGIVLSLMLLLGLGVTLQVRAQLIRSLETRLQEQSVSLARDIAARAADLILINDLFGLHQLLEDTRANNLDVRYAFILDPQGVPIVHTFGSGFPEGLAQANACTSCDRHRSTALETDEGRIWDAAVPIMEGKAGVARVGLSEASLERTLATVTTQLLLSTLLVAVIGVAAGGFLTWILTRPILALVAATKAVAQGDLSQRVERWANDEIGELAEAFNAMTAELSQAEHARLERDRLRAQLLDQVITAQEEERKRIARELHDETGQALTSLLVGLRAMREVCPTPEIVKQAEELRMVATRTLENLHNLALELRPSILDDMGLVAALERYVAEYRARFGIQVDLVAHGFADRRLPPPVETALFRIIQEGLTNIARHSGASTASILLERRPQSLLAVIEDDGRGFDPDQIQHANPRLGLYGMQERVELLRGTFTIESGPGLGTSLFVEIPIEPTELAEMTPPADQRVTQSDEVERDG